MPIRRAAQTRPQLMDLRLVAYTNGILLLILAAALGLLGLSALTENGSYDLAFIGGGFTTAFFGGLLVAANRGRWHGVISVRTGYLMTFSCWLMLALFSTLPLYYSDLGLSFSDALFETVSALTTTGSTVISGLDDMPRDLLLWRSILQWLGGIGIIVMAMAILPMLKVGGMNLFKSESSDITGKVTARMDFFVKVTVAAYAILTTICAFLYKLAGMSWFDAVNHAMATISTGGFSTHDASMGYFNSAWIEAIAIVFMMAGAIPLVMYVKFLIFYRGDKSMQSYTQVKGFLCIWAVAVAIMAFWNWQENGMAFLSALRVSAFNITSILTDTGFATADFSQWGHFAIGFFFFLYFVGGCAGSTSGAVKVFRWQILFKGLYAQFKRNLSPNAVITVHYAGKPLDEKVMHSVRNFLFLYFVTFCFFSLVMMGFGIDFLGSVSSVAQAMANAGPALTATLGPAGNFSSIPDGAKWILSLVMIIGRLELFTFYALLLPSFWRQ